ncbi:MAG: thrombospondin type 3 repeat-containing protein, partial [Myxococcota bacterium]|nr:thrombospondin type 3 repeat-containing protein [Myxococcota bacterium]
MIFRFSSLAHRGLCSDLTLLSTALCLFALIACTEEEEEATGSTASCEARCGENTRCLERCEMSGATRADQGEPSLDQGLCPYEEAARCQSCEVDRDCAAEEDCERGWCMPISCGPNRPCPPERGLVCEDGLCQIALDADQDRDGIPDALDNCPAAPNPGQNDCDNDGIGDPCDEVSGCGATLMGIIERGEVGEPVPLREPRSYLEVEGLPISARADDRANFRLDDLPEGIHRIFVYAPTPSESAESQSWSGFNGPLLGFDEIEIRAADFDQSLSRDLLLNPTGDIGGQVYLSDLP